MKASEATDDETGSSCRDSNSFMRALLLMSDADLATLRHSSRWDTMRGALVFTVQAIYKLAHTCSG